MRRSLFFWLCLSLAGLWLVSCAPAATQSPAVPAAVEVTASASTPEVEKQHIATQAPQAAPTLPPQATPTANAGLAPAYAATAVQEEAQPTFIPLETLPTPVNAVHEQRMVELEYPLEMHLGESDLIRLALVPYEDHYTITTEFPEHTVKTQTVQVERPKGYILKGIARLDAAGFKLSPASEQERLLPPGETVTWRWSLVPNAPGRQRLAMTLLLRWEPESGWEGPSRQAEVFSRGLELNVTSFLGLSRPQALSTGFIGLVLGSIFSLAAVVGGWKRPRQQFSWRAINPNPQVLIEPLPGLTFKSDETRLLQALFNRYSRLVIENEFLSGYSGARTLLVRPIRSEGQSDAATIVKMGARHTIQMEFENYETYVKDRLPPITARIQQAPVTTRSSQRAALQYTFITEPGHQPTSLHQALLNQPDPALIQRLFDSFGPSWWMQRQPAVFRWGQEYDNLLPPHLVLEPLPAGLPPRMVLSETSKPSHLQVAKGELIGVSAFIHYDIRSDGQSLTLYGEAQPGEPALRLRWLSPTPPIRPTAARVRQLRTDLLGDLTGDLSLNNLPDPLPNLPNLLYQNISGSLSIIHGDLNLENILVGPGGFVWLIDFARTRLGHPLFDFAHLEAELIAHILAPRQLTPEAFLDLLKNGTDPLLSKVETIARQCLFNPSHPQEYQTALGLACLGALKFANLSRSARQLLYLAAAYYLNPSR